MASALSITGAGARSELDLDTRDRSERRKLPGAGRTVPVLQRKPRRDRRACPASDEHDAMVAAVLWRILRSARRRDFDHDGWDVRLHELQLRGLIVPPPSRLTRPAARCRRKLCQRWRREGH
eukprot:768650-Hanusia_phi.AAC.3